MPALWGPALAVVDALPLEGVLRCTCVARLYTLRGRSDMVKDRMTEATRQENEQFENDVRRIARALWPAAEFFGATHIDGREYDGIFETEECIHIIEATTSRRVQKAKQDIDKLKRAMTKYRGADKYRAIRGWFITRDEPTADQRGLANQRRDGINVLSFSQFQARIIDSKSYLDARDKYPFGSVRDPKTGDNDPTVKYVPLDLVKTGTLDNIPHDDISSLLESGRIIVLLGDYGAGKSMTLRQIYRDLKRSHIKRGERRFPVYLNLRDHYGQTDPAEVIERHGKSIGFALPSTLVRAWRAGSIHLLIDGFDEISTINVQGTWRKLKENRFRAMNLIRRLIAGHPSDAGIIVAGREQFFDSQDERRIALNLPQNAVEISLNEFTEQQIENYLQQAGLSGFIPPWLPSRPLLVGYLATTGLLNDVVDGDAASEMNRDEGWNFLLDRVSSREAEIEAGIDGATVRRILERLATKARTSADGLSNLSPDSVNQAFNEICGYSPDEHNMVLLQRLPGLGVDRKEEESRKFVDRAFADACRAGDLVAFADGPYDFQSSVLADMESAIGVLGIEVAAFVATRSGFSEGKLNAALTKGKSIRGHLVVDLARLVVQCGFNVRSSVKIERLLIPEVELGANSADSSSIEFRDCFFSRIEIDLSAEASRLPRFFECYIGELDGRVSFDDLPQGRFDDACSIERYTVSADTTHTVLTLDHPLGVRVCITILKKLYEQAGAGRKESALYRGLDSHARRLVPDVLRALQTEGLARSYPSRGGRIWLPDRRSMTRVGRMIAAPAMSNDPVIHRCEGL